MKADNKRGDEVSVHCGNVSESLEVLQELCRNEAEKLLSNIDFSSSDEVAVSFWTKDVHELICVGHFYKKDGKTISYDLDFSETTL